MVRGLLIRQALTAVNLLLALGIAYVIYLIGVQQFGPKVVVTELDLEGIGDSELKVAKVGPREAYQPIVSGRLFGDAGSTPPPPPPPVEAEPTVVASTSPLKLLATVTSSPTDPLATAIIDNPTAPPPAPKVSTYYLNQVVMPGLKLAEVHRRRVRLFNENKNQYEELTIQAPGTGTVTGQPGSPGGRSRQGAEGATESANHVTLERQAILDEVNAYSYTDLMAELNPQLVEDDKGNVIGITSASLENIPLAQSAGLKNNDVIQSINGMNIDSEQKIGEIAQKIGPANTVRLSITRDGKPQTLTIKVQ